MGKNWRMKILKILYILSFSLKPPKQLQNKVIRDGKKIQVCSIIDQGIFKIVWNNFIKLEKSCQLAQMAKQSFWQKLSTEHKWFKLPSRTMNMIWEGAKLLIPSNRFLATTKIS